jgi:hypothetical protein
MRLLFSLLRVAVLCALVVILWAKPRVTDAQLVHQCLTFDTVTIDCPSCCSQHNFVNNAVTTSGGVGDMSIQEVNLVCGTTPATCGGVACGTQEVPQAVPDSYCLTSCK